MQKILIVLIVIAGLIVSGCDSSVYNKMKEIPSEGWDKDYPIKFDVNITDTTGLFDFYFMLRHNTDYAWSNLFCFVTTTMPGDSMKVDTIEFVLADTDGRWLGDGTGHLRTNEVMISRKFVFPHAGLYSFEFRQAMRDTLLTGISDIGIRITPTQL